MQGDNATFVKIINRLQSKEHYSYRNWVDECIASTGIEYPTAQDVYVHFRRVMYLGKVDRYQSMAVARDFWHFVKDFYEEMFKVKIARRIQVDTLDDGIFDFDENTTLGDVFEQLGEIAPIWFFDVKHDLKNMLCVHLRVKEKCMGITGCPNTTFYPKEDGHWFVNEGHWCCSECYEAFLKEQDGGYVTPDPPPKVYCRGCDVKTRSASKDGWCQLSRGGMLCPGCQKLLDKEEKSAKKTCKGK